MKQRTHTPASASARRLVLGRIILGLCLLGGAVEARSQERAPVGFSATQMGHSTEATVYSDYVTIYGKVGRKTYLYQDLSALPFRKFQLHVEAAGESGDNHWPELGIAFNDTLNVLKTLAINGTAFQSYDLGVFTAPVRGSVYLVFMNDYYNPVTGQDVNLKLRRAVLTPVAAGHDTVFVSGTRLTLRWNANAERDLAGYKVYHGEASGNYGREPTTVSRDSSSQVLAVTSNRDYFFAVSAFDSAGNESALSQEVMARVSAPVVTPTTDLNHDGKCDKEDLKKFNDTFALSCSHRDFNPEADFTGDCKIDGRDRTIFMQRCK